MTSRSTHYGDLASIGRVAAVFLIVVVATLSYLWQHAHMVSLGYQVEAQRTALGKLSHHRAELLLEVASLSALPRIERIAREQLGMEPPRPAQLVRVVFPPSQPDEAAAPVMLASRSLP